jgi:protein gp37
MARRLECIKTTAERYKNIVGEFGWTGRLNFVPSELEKPYKWKKPRRIFVGSMTDICHPKVSFDWYAQIYKCIKENPQHIFLLLTKRADRLISLYGYRTLPNIWLGVTVENQEMADLRIPKLMNTRLHPDAKKWISVEPMLGAVNPFTSEIFNKQNDPFDNLDLVVCGGENGTNCRTMKTDWALDLYRQCKEAGVPFWFKGWGGGETYRGNGDMGLIWDIQLCKELPR